MRDGNDGWEDGFKVIDIVVSLPMRDGNYIGA